MDRRLRHLIRAQIDQDWLARRIDRRWVLANARPVDGTALCTVCGLPFNEHPVEHREAALTSGLKHRLLRLCDNTLGYCTETC